jgi:squalene synthase HpnC
VAPNLLLVTSEVPISVDSAADPRRYLVLAKRHYENFPVGSWLLPARARVHLHRIYAFARIADDLADEWRDAAALAAYRRDFLAHVEGNAADVPLFADLRTSIRECDLEVSLFTRLLDAFAQDLEVGRYDLEGLLDYCRKSADPVGRLVLRVCGYRDDGLDRLSDSVCTGLQLLNHLQDLRSDLVQRDRIYFPSEDLRRFGVAEDDLRAASANAAVRALVLHWHSRIGAMFTAGWPLMRCVRGRLRWELRAILRGAAAVLARIRSCEGDVLAGRVRLRRLERVRSVLAGLCSARMPDFGGGAP